MSTFQTTEEATTDIQHNLTHLKTYSFFVFYAGAPAKSSAYMQKMTFKIKEDRENKNSAQHKYVSGQNWKVLSMGFYQMVAEHQIIRGLTDLKAAGSQSKSKIVLYGSESQLIYLLGRAQSFEVDLSSVPIILCSEGINSDLSQFMGWDSLANKEEFNEMEMGKLQQLGRKWIKCSTERIDLWSAEIRLAPDGTIQRIIDKEVVPMPTEGGKLNSPNQINNTIVKVSNADQKTQVASIRFLSHFSLGYHPKLTFNYELTRSSPASKSTNSCWFSWQKLKNFCCMGEQTMHSSTGVVSINYIADNKQEIEIMKHFSDADGSEEQEDHKKDRDAGVLSILLSNIDRYHGKRISTPSTCKINDNRLELSLFVSSTNSRKLASIAGQIILRFDAIKTHAKKIIQPQNTTDELFKSSSNPLYMQIGEDAYRVVGCKDVRIKVVGRVRVAINQSILGC